MYFNLMETKEIISNFFSITKVYNYGASWNILSGYSIVLIIITIIILIMLFCYRCELVRERRGVRWYNDSIGSSPSRTIAGLVAFPDKVILIAGGYDKHIPYDPLGQVAVDTVKHAILMGATADAIETAIRTYSDLPITRVANMEEAVAAAAEIAGDGDVVFMSPASASFDMYKNFEVRGNHFKDLVNALHD